MLMRIKNNTKHIFTCFTAITSFAFGMLTVAQIFLGWDSFGIKNDDIECKISIFCIIIAVCAAIAFIVSIFFSNRKTIYSKDEIRIIVKYDNLLKIAFPKKPKKEKIVVIAVNRCFDTVISQDLIKAESVHGQFLQKFVKNDRERKNLDDRIETSLDTFGYQYDHLDSSEKRYGKLHRYPLGSVARINGENGVTFFLLALTTFDINCNAHCTKREYIECMLKLFEYYDKHGQGHDLYLYPMGTNMARTGLSKRDALETIVTLTKISKEYLKSKTTIIVDRRYKNDVTIMNYN